MAGSILATSSPRPECFKLELFSCFGKPGQPEGDYQEASGVAINSNQEIILADHRYNRIQVFDMQGCLQREIQPPVHGAGSLSSPAKVAVNQTGLIYVAQRYSNGIKIFNPEESFPNSVGEFGAHRQKKGLTVDDRHNVLMLMHDAYGSVLKIFKQDGNSEQYNLWKKLISPNGLAALDEKVYISDFASEFIEIFDYSGNHIGKFGREDLTKNAIGVCVSENDEVLVGTKTAVGFKLSKFKTDGTLLSVHNSRFYHHKVRDMAVQGEFAVVASSDGVYVYKFTKDCDHLDDLDSDKIRRRRMNLSGGFAGWDGAERCNILPTGVAVDDSDNIFVADAKQGRIQGFGSSGTPHCKVVTVNKDYLDFRLMDPGKLTIDRRRNAILVIDRKPKARIVMLGWAVGCVKIIESELLVDPRGLAVDRNGNIFVIEHDCFSVRVFDATGSLSKLLNCKMLGSPVDITISEKEEIFIADNAHHCIQVYNYKGEFQRRFGNPSITNSPLCVATVRDGLIVVADKKEGINLTLFTEEGKFVKGYVTKICHLSCKAISVLRDGRIVVASDDADRQIFIYGEWLTHEMVI